MYLSATTLTTTGYIGIGSDNDKIVQELYYPLSDETSIIVRVFKEKKSKYFYNFKNGISDGWFIYNISGQKTTTNDESVFLIPIIKKDEKKTCLGVIVLHGKQKTRHTISTSYWEQDKGLIEFIVEMYTRISEADSERLTFLSQLRHELLTPITELVTENNFLFDRYKIRKDPFDKREVLGQLNNNMDNCFLFKHIIADIELIYSSSIKDVDYKIELQDNPREILEEVVALFRTAIPISMAISKMPPLYLDKYRIKQVFINILKNAIKYSYDGQPVEIYYKSPEENDTMQHEIKFVNYGKGIEDEEKDRIFELYERGSASKNKPSGSGLGLYIVKEIMLAHDGDCIIRKLKNPTEISLIFPARMNKNDNEL
jgi:signal transduction histidine kinase